MKVERKNITISGAIGADGKFSDTIKQENIFDELTIKQITVSNVAASPVQALIIYSDDWLNSSIGTGLVGNVTNPNLTFSIKGRAFPTTPSFSVKVPATVATLYTTAQNVVIDIELIKYVDLK